MNEKLKDLAAKIEEGESDRPERLDPVICRIVHFRLDSTKCRPAIIVNQVGQGFVNLIVFLDGLNDASPERKSQEFPMARWETSVAEGHEDRHWHPPTECIGHVSQEPKK